MTELPPEEKVDEIVDLDQCSKKKSILIGAAFAYALSLIPYTWVAMGLHLGVCGAITVGHFTKRHAITVRFLTGAKLGVLAMVLGIAAFYVTQPLWGIKNLPEDQWEEFKGNMVESFYQNGNAEAAAELEKMDYSSVMPTVLVGALIFFVLFAAILGFLGGGLGASLYKKGPEAR